MFLDFGSKRRGATAQPGPGGDVATDSGTIGGYRLLDRIGSGGFGSVFKAADPETGRLVAIKICQLGKDGHARFFREARLAGGLRHPNIAAVFESGMHGDTPFMVQELLTGRDLSAMILERQPYELDEKRRILVAIAEGLDYAHRKGVIHRDINPSNVRILEDGGVKIMDFGIARTVDSKTGMTRVGTAVGTVAYMSPEQMSGGEIGPRTDVFLLGVLAYELLSFQPAFRHSNLFRLMELILNEDPHPLIDIAPSVPDGLAAVVAKAMRKAPDERFASAAELRDALMAPSP
jgi:serine/threonine-protein kinase